MKKHNTPILPKLSYNERTIVAPAIKKLLKNYPNTYFKNYEIIMELENKGFKTNAPAVRKMINYLRCLNVPICSTNKGYAYSVDEKELMNTIMQLQQRIDAMVYARDGIKYNLLWIMRKREDPNITLDDILNEFIDGNDFF